MDSSNEEIFTVVKLSHGKLAACIKDDTLGEYLSDAFSEAMRKVVTYIEEEIEAGVLPTPEPKDG
jgi:hypothetical protein